MAPTVPIEFAGQKESKNCSISQVMGKSRKYSKGHSSGFVPDYRHHVETMAESEGFGSSARFDTEMTASEDSCAPKRKCISLNMDDYDSLGVPLQVLTLSKMSRSERRNLEFRLKMELEQVRVLQNKVASLTSNAVVSPSSDIRSCSDGQKRPPLENFQRPSEAAAPKGKKRAPPGRHGPQTKRSTSGRFDSVKLAASVNTSSVQLMKQCEKLLNHLMSQQFSWVFNTPVDIVELDIPDYFTVIKHPMDLGTVKSKLVSGRYSSPLGFSADVRLTFSNAMTYNPPGNDVHVMAETLSKYFEGRWKAIEKKLPMTTDVPLLPSRAGSIVETETTKGMQPAKRKTAPPSDKVKQEHVRRIMTSEEKRILSTELEASLDDLPENIIDFLKERSCGAGQIAEDELEIDIDALPDDTLFELRKMLDDHLLDKQKNQAKSEPCEMEILNESGFSNSSMQLGKGNGMADEDVDIVGGNDPPVANIPALDIEKDAAHKNSSSSSESGSSTSDSDSGSSSGSESDAAKASVPADILEGNLGPGANLDEKISEVGVSDIGNLNLDPPELNSQGKPVAIEVDSHHEGESAPSERQVSPEKLYRAALLRNRFADTILKARVKALEKVDKCNPEKLRIEREELERQQREEKARLQAEAKAAEEARRKAEAKAAAEAKRKRELEREAARQALQQMEKTVDINENSQFMEDLEMLRTAQDEHIPSFVEETSPEQFQNGMGSFKFQGSSNPLEQLGLYMKMDDDDEEEVEPPQSIVNPVKDVEEGEID
ncbi:transcription factor GTE10-like isoform X2 [Mangifera indica]|uniref:transcription factor GTE10-like isoform X2 n=1 Tax=Mangifera indica TaxID=29780 RepID=UPI001CF95B47|nr:transcription factor GTE10-like isoform X2 [Mangifera indica]